MEADCSSSLLGYSYSSGESTIFFFITFSLVDLRYTEVVLALDDYLLILVWYFWDLLFLICAGSVDYLSYFWLFFCFPFVFLLDFNYTFLSYSNDSEFSYVYWTLLSYSIFFLSFFSAFWTVFDFVFWTAS